MLQLGQDGIRLGDEPASQFKDGFRSSGKWRGLVTGLRVCAWLHLLAVLVVWLVLRFGGDRWWFATVMLFGPRWIYGLPLVVLVPAALAVKRRLLMPLLVSGGIVVGPIMGLSVGWARLWSTEGPSLRVLTLNVNQRAVDAEALRLLIERSGADAVALQECNGDLAGAIPATWEVRRAGQLLVASRFAIHHVEVLRRMRPESPWPPVNALYCGLETDWGRLGFCSIHLNTPRVGIGAVLNRQTGIDPSRSEDLTAETEMRRSESEDVTEWLRGFPDALVIAGDFNMPVDSEIYGRYWSRFRNAFSQTGLGFGHTKHTVIHGFLYGLRIDHVLTDSNWRPYRCWVGVDVGSDHLPVVADLRWESSPHVPVPE